MSVTAMTQTEMVAEVANTIGRDSTSLSADQATTYATRIKQWLFWSHMTMARLYAFPELDQDPITYTLSTSTNVYSFATLGITRLRQVLGITFVDGQSSYKLTQKLARNFEELFPYVAGQTQRDPRFYTLYGQRLELDRIPAAANAIQIRYNRLPNDFASAGAASQYINKDDVLVAGAIVHAYISLQENEDAEKWAAIFKGRLTGAVGHEIEHGDWEPEGRASDFNGVRTFNTSIEDNPLVMFNP